MPHTQRPLVINLIALGAAVLLAGGFATTVADDNPGFRPIAHAHNDYYHPRPLLDALDHGFTSIEADVFPVDHELLVAHSDRELDPNKTLDRLYLRPLQELADESGQTYKAVESRLGRLRLKLKTNLLNHLRHEESA